MSLQRIAKIAGVSIATVSNALNGTGRVSAELAERIREIARKENYVIRPRKRAQPRERKRIAFTMADQRTSIRHSDYNITIFEGIQSRVESLGYSLNMRSRVHMHDIGMQTSDCIGIILLGHMPDPQPYVRAAGKPLVWVTRYDTGTADAVLENNREIARLAAEYLIARGHKMIGYVDDQYINTVSDRGFYFSKFVEEAGGKVLVVRDKPIFDILRDYFYVNTDKLDNLLTKLFSGRNKPTALFSPGDLMTIHIYSFLKRNGIRPMKDVDVVSCNNEMPYIGELSPRPPTIDFNLFSMGQRAAEMLHWRLSNPDEPQQKLLIQPRLVLPDA